MKREFNVEFNYDHFKLIERLLERELQFEIFEDDEINLDYCINLLRAYKQYRDIEWHLVSTAGKFNEAEAVAECAELECEYCDGNCCEPECETEAENESDDEVVREKTKLEAETDDDSIMVQVEADDLQDFFRILESMFI